jgi:hypothetical protein
MHKLLALNQRQKMVSFSLIYFLPSSIFQIAWLSFAPLCLKLQVLQRKTEEATAASKRLKELLEAKKSIRETYGARLQQIKCCH